MPSIEFLLDKDLVTEKMIKALDQEGRWEMVAMIETNKKGAVCACKLFSSCCVLDMASV